MISNVACPVSCDKIGHLTFSSANQITIFPSGKLVKQHPSNSQSNLIAAKFS